MSNIIHLIDAHTHLDHLLFKGLGSELVYHLTKEGFNDADRHFVFDKMVIPAISYDSNREARSMFKSAKFDNIIYYAVGKHPKDVNRDATWDKEHRLQFEDWLSDPHTVAIKTGLDHSNLHLDNHQKQHQVDFMKMFCEFANRKHLPLVIHSRDAAEETLAILQETPVWKSEVHCCTYEWSVVSELLKYGVEYFGITAKLLFDEAEGLREVVHLLSLENIIIESDSPILAAPPGTNIECPPGIEGLLDCTKTPMILPKIAQCISEIKGIPVTNVYEQTYKNAMRFFGW